MLVSCLAYSSTLKMESICSSKMLVDVQQTTQRYIPEDRTLHNHNSETLKSSITGHCFTFFVITPSFAFGRLFVPSIKLFIEVMNVLENF
jgi:hypothetical protein